jgi:FkbM family methyltransferase
MNWKDKGRLFARKLMHLSLLREVLRRLSMAGFLPPAIWKRLPVEVVFPVKLPDGRSFFYSATPNDVIARALYWRGLKDWESETIPVFYKMAQSAQIVLDIGANTGFYTLLACTANPNARVIAFEPVPRVYEKLMEHIRINHFDGRCEAHRMAVSNFVGTAQMHVPFGDLPTSASLNTDGFRGFSGILVEVPVTTVDAVMGDQPVDLAKIDVEGFEPQVLEGMRMTLRRFRPALFIECLPDGPYREVEEILKNLGYQIYLLSHNGPIQVEQVVPRRVYHENFLFIHPEGRIKI